MTAAHIRESITTVRTTIAGLSACTIITGSHVVAVGELARHQTNLLAAIALKTAERDPFLPSPESVLKTLFKANRKARK